MIFLIHPIVIHNYYLQPGGEDEVFQAEVAMLSRSGHYITKFVARNEKLSTIGHFRASVETIWSWPKRQKLLHILHFQNPDIAHFHNIFWRISPSAYYACKSADVVVVQTLHNYRLLCPAATFMREGWICEECLLKTIPWPALRYGCWRGSRAATAVIAAMLVLHRLLKTWQRQVDLYIALTEFSRQKFIQGGLPPKKIVVKPNFVYPDPGYGRHRLDYALFVGRISPEKGVKRLVEAWKSLPTIPLKLIGDGPIAITLQERADKLGLQQIKWLGHRPREYVMRAMQSARFLIFPSEWYEGFALVIIEAFACGTPVIASRLGAMTEIIENGKTGMHFTSGDASDLAAKVEWAWHHPSEMADMGLAARREYEEKYTADLNYKQLMDIYLKATKNHYKQ